MEFRAARTGSSAAGTTEMKKESRGRGGGGETWPSGFSADRDSTDKSASLVASVIAIVPTKGDKSPRLKPFPDPVSISRSGYASIHGHACKSCVSTAFSSPLS